MSNDNGLALVGEEVEIAWRRLDPPKNWKPSKEGEELIGYYLGKTLRNGKFGQYEVVVIKVPDADVSAPYAVSGTTVVQAVDCADVCRGDLLRVVWKGWKDLGGDRRMKLFEVYSAGDSIPEETAIAYMDQVEEG